jgi:hypothetical protein
MTPRKRQALSRSAMAVTSLHSLVLTPAITRQKESACELNG